jgi:hypothetical protein
MSGSDPGPGSGSGIGPGVGRGGMGEEFCKGVIKQFLFCRGSSSYLLLRVCTDRLAHIALSFLISSTVAVVVLSS